MRIQASEVAYALVLAGGLFLSSCQQSSQKPSVIRRPLSPPPPGNLKYAGAPPLQPFASRPGNHYARTVFETDGPGNSHLEVRDILVPPRSRSSIAVLPGFAVLDLAASKATVSVGGKLQTAPAGRIQSLPMGQSLDLENSDLRPAIVRLYVFRAR